MANAPHQLTVKELLRQCEIQVKKGNGDKVIIISDDNEGNGFHGLFYDFTENLDSFRDMISDSVEDTSDKAIILG